MNRAKTSNDKSKWYSVVCQSSMLCVWMRAMDYITSNASKEHCDLYLVFIESILQSSTLSLNSIALISVAPMVTVCDNLILFHLGSGEKITNNK